METDIKIPGYNSSKLPYTREKSIMARLDNYLRKKESELKAFKSSKSK